MFIWDGQTDIVRKEKQIKRETTFVIIESAGWQWDRQKEKQINLDIDLVTFEKERMEDHRRLTQRQTDRQWDAIGKSLGPTWKEKRIIYFIQQSGR